MAAPKGNTYAVGNPNSGRPLKFQTVEEVQKKIDKYFDDCIRIDPVTGDKIYTRPLTMTGLANALDTDRMTLVDYSKREVFSSTILQAKRRVEQYAEEQLFVGKNPNGVIFNMLNNYKGNWQDTRSNGNQQININVGPQKTVEEREGNFEALSEAVTDNEIKIVSEQ